MAITDYDTLVATVKAYAARSDSTFSARMPEFVGMAEARLYDGFEPGRPDDPLHSPPLRSNLMEAAGTRTTVAGSVALPDDYLEMRSIYRSGDTVGLTYQPPERASVANAIEAAGLPVFYTIAANRLTLIPSWDGVLSINYWRRFDAISATNTTGDLIAAHGLAYLEATLIEAFSFLQAGDLAVGHAAKLRGMLRGINRSAARLRYSGPLRVRIRAALP